MKSLSKTILDAARDEVVQDYDFHIEGKCQTWNQFVESAIMDNSEMDFLLYSEKAALLAMEKQAGFLLWTFWMDWIYSDGRFMNSKSGDVLPELELYNIWREATTLQ